MTEHEEWIELIGKLCDKRDADYFLFCGPMYEEQADKIINTVRNLKTKRTNVALVLCTNGGNADAAYQIARALKRRYKKLILYVFGHCKSAGTLVAVAADEIVMSEFGHFGPLDIQLADKEEVFAQTPALDVQQSLATLSKFTFDSFFDYFLKLDPGRMMSTKTASEVSKTLALGITTAIAGQIDPLLLGRVDRSMKIAEAYAERLNKDFKAKNKLSGGYPSHSFVIDYEEAKTIFNSIREPDEDELRLESKLRSWGRLPRPSSEWIGQISLEKTTSPTVNPNGKADSENKATTDAGQAKQTATASAMGATAAVATTGS